MFRSWLDGGGCVSHVVLEPWYSELRGLREEVMTGGLWALVDGEHVGGWWGPHGLLD